MGEELTGESAWMPDRYPQLDPEDQAHKEIRVVGPPGCGKTTYLADQCARVAVPKYGSNNVMLCSLTRTAAAQIVKAETNVPRENVGTLHALAYRALDKPAIAEDAKALVKWNEEAPGRYRVDIKSVAASPSQLDDVPVEVTYDDADGTTLLQSLGLLRAACRPRELWPPEVIGFDEEWTAFKQRHELLDFTDLIDAALEMPQHPSMPKVFMADEAQDMSRLEMKLLRQWGGAAPRLVIVGDPDQALYTWRGADPDSVFGHDLGDVLVREQGYRVPELVRAWAQEWIEQMPDRLPVTYLPRMADGQVVEGKLTHEEGMTWKNPQLVIADAQRHLDEGRTVMILTSCGYMLEPIITELRAHGIPFGNRWRTTNGRWNPLAGTSRLLSFLRPSKKAWEDEARMWTWRELHRWSSVLVAKGLMNRGIKTFVESKVTKDRFGEATDEDMLTTLEFVRSMFLSEEDALAAAMLDVDWWHEHLRHADAQKQAYAIKVWKAHGAQALRERPRLTIGTIHSVKGGEADVVYLMPDLSQAGYYGGWNEGIDSPNKASIFRQFYVGATRAREHLILCGPAGREHVPWV